jgi:hypothetical protein
VVAAKKKPRRLLYFTAAGAAQSISQETLHVIQYQASDPDIAETGNDCCNIGESFLKAPGIHVQPTRSWD